jgi:hypothetical protein
MATSEKAVGEEHWGSTESETVGEIYTPEKDKGKNKSAGIFRIIRWIIWNGNCIFVEACCGREVTKSRPFLGF